MAKDNVTDVWKEYEAGRDYNERIGLYDNVSRNELFYIGDQWHGVDSGGLPTPVFNVVGRIVNFLVSSVLTHAVSVSYRDGGNYTSPSHDRERIASAVGLLNRSAHHRWEKLKMESLLRDGLLDAALSGDAVFYCHWDGSVDTGQLYRGDISVSRADTRDLFVADVCLDDIQKQDYIILRGRCPVEKLRDEAKAYGLIDEVILPRKK